MSTLIKRYFFFILGLIINSFGVAFITKSALGTSQISSIPYVLSLKFTNLSFLFFHRLNGIGLGTIISAVLIGPMISFVNGAIVEQAKLYGVPVPYNSLIVDLIHSLEGTKNYK